MNWEYKVVNVCDKKIAHERGIAKFQEVLDEYIEAGWELFNFQVCEFSGSVVIVFRRRSE